jgi:hypothetical protein
MSLWGKTAKYRSINGATIIPLVLQEASTQTFKAGDFVYLASNAVTAIVAPDTLVNYNSTKANTGTNKIVGMALDDATGTTGRDIRVVLATDDVEFEFNVAHATITSASTAATQVGQTMELLNLTLPIGTVDGEGYALPVATTSTAVAIDDTTDGEVVITSVPKAGVLLGKVWGKIASGARAPLNA